MYSRNVWKDIDELGFHEQAIFLEACSRSQDKEPNSHINIRQPDKLDLPSASYFLDDFALVAAGPGGASNVTAACLELSQGSDGNEIITIRLAKNEAFDLQAQEMLSQITEIMNHARQRGASCSQL